MKINTKKWGIVFGIIIILFFSINGILSVVISNIVNTQLDEINSQGKLKVTIGKINFNVFSSNLNLKNVRVKPDSLFFENFKQGHIEKASTSEFVLSDLKVQGFGIYNILVNKEIYARKIIAKGLQLSLYKSDKYLKKKTSDSAKTNKTIDSIFIKGINKIDFRSIVFDDFEFRIIQVQSNDTLFSYKEKECEITGIDLIANDTIENYFEFNKANLKVNFEEQEIKTNDGNYIIVLNKIKYDYKTSSLLISNFNMNPTTEREKLASTFKYNTEVYEFETEAIQLKGFHLDRILRTGIIKLDTVLVESPRIGIYKDQTKPFNLNKRPKFLNQKLKALEQPINIEKVFIKNAVLNYREKHEDFKELMTLDISDFNVEISNITSLKDSLATGKDLKINLKGNICNVAPMNLDILMHYATWNNSYSFTGGIGKANFTSFNPALYPGTGVNFSAGTLNSIEFYAYGTPSGSTGRMTMLYDHLEADFANNEKKNKGLSWVANTVLLESNPSRKGKLRVAEIEFERVPYKSFGNLLWKSVMSGMVNTLLPIGKKVKDKKPKNKHSRRKN